MDRSTLGARKGRFSFSCRGEGFSSANKTDFETLEKYKSSYLMFFVVPSSWPSFNDDGCRLKRRRN